MWFIAKEVVVAFPNLFESEADPEIAPRIVAAGTKFINVHVTHERVCTASFGRAVHLYMF